MEDSCADIGEALDGLDDFFQDENLFQDLEDLGKVLDELNEADDGEESSDAGESSAASKRDVEFDPDKLPEIDDILNSPAKKSPTVELEDGEISEVDEKNELKELKKRKTEVINKMKKLVKHKIQLTNQRNDLLLQLQTNAHLDKVTTLLKENSQLVKAISNQIFRMNPEIKVLNGKIKELEASIGTETDEGKDQKVESTPAQDFTASRKDLENIENFFNRFSKVGNVKNKKEEVGKSKKEEKGDERPAESKSFGSNAIKRFLSLDETSGPSKPLSAELNKEIVGKLPLPSQKSRRLVSDENKIKMMFEKVCEITEKQQSSLSSTSGSNTRVADKKVTHDSEQKKESQFTTKISNKSVENSIDMRLKEIRLQGSKINFVDLTGGDQEKPKRRISPIRIDKGRISPIRLDKGLSQSDSFEKQNRKRKVIGDREFDETNLASKKVKETESTVASNIPKSLLERLGSVPVKDKSFSNSLNESKDEAPIGFIPDKLHIIRPPEERSSFWCQCCSRGFQSTQAYVSHLESLKHLKVAMAKQSGMQGAHCDVPKDNTWSDASAAWYKSSSNKQGDEIPARSEASSGDLCIAVMVNDTFCTKKQLGHFHSRCFAHAKCLLRDKDNRIGYSPDSCSVCMEYLQNSHSSLKCCDRIFRIFKTFKKRCGLSFDWEDKALKDWFFDNYRKVQDGSDTAKKSTVSYEDFKAQMKPCGSSSQNVDNAADVVIEQGVENELSSMERLSDVKPLAKKDVDREKSPKTICKSSSAATKQASSVNSKSLELRSVLGKKLITVGNKLKHSSVEGCSENYPICNLLQKYSKASRDTSKNHLHSYNVVFEKDDPFITEICKKTVPLDKRIPSQNLLQGIHTQFNSTNVESVKLMNFLHRKLFEVSDLSFKFGETEGYCSLQLLERFNITKRLAESQFNVYAALLAVITSVREFSAITSSGQEVSQFHKCLMESIECLAKEMVNPLTYCVSMALQDKHNLRRSGFKLQVENDTIGTLLRYNIFSKGLFDEQALKTTFNSSKHLSKFVNTEKYQENKQKGVGGVSI
ncbi:uncharacterized protein [Palaemon carinicauda]|uniref:uncharacterized protein n=1 Tax=Palaemon carinicauda TaxID=392227 RepID=UPI0035B6778E